MSEEIFYPSLSSILPLSKIPNSLEFIEKGIEEMLSSIYYKDYVMDETEFGSAGIYNLQIVLLKRIGFDIPATGGISIAINPEDQTPGITTLPIKVTYSWPVINFINSFSIDKFSAQFKSYFELVYEILDISDEDLIQRTLDFFESDSDDYLQSFINKYNAKYTTRNFVSESTNTIPENINLLIYEFENAGISILSVISDLYFDHNSSNSELLDVLEKFLLEDLLGIEVTDLKKFLLPLITAQIQDVFIALEFPRKMLQPIDAFGNILTDETIKSKLKYHVGSFNFSTESGVNFEGENSFLFTPSQIGNTGLTLAFSNVKLDLSTTTNIPEATADGRSNDFRGVYIDSATIGLPKKWFNQESGATLGIFAEKLLIGTGGISGTIGLKALGGGAVTGELAYKLGENIRIGFSKFDVVFERGKVVHSDIIGSLTVPIKGNTTKIDITMSFDDNGDFKIIGSVKAGVEIPVGNEFLITLFSVEIGEKDDQFYLACAADLSFPDTSIVYTSLGITEPFHLQKLIIWENGRIELEGGTLPLPKSITVPLGPAKLNVTAIHFGSHEQDNRKYNFWGFDGGVNVNPGGVDVRGTGLKYFYTIDDDAAQQKTHKSHISIDSLAIDLIIPGDASKEDATVLIHGFLAVNGAEYMGGVDVSLPKVGINGGMDMRFDTKYPAWIVDAQLDFPSPIPLASTGLGIYGFRGLLGKRYVATKHATGLDDTASWFDYYKSKKNAPNREGVNLGKFEKPTQTSSNKKPFSVGVGTTIATTTDEGKPFSTKLFLLLSMPSVIYLEGKANVLGPRVGLDGTDPPFFAVVAYEPKKSVEFSFGADYKIGDQGRILKLYAEVGAGYFFDNPSAWYINFGTEKKPITCEVLSLFTAKSYLMINRREIKTMARVDFGFNKSYCKGAVKAQANVYIEVGGHISFLKPQIGAYAKVGGGVDVSFMGCGFFISVNTTLAVEVPQPFLIAGSAELCVGVRIFRKRFEKCFTVEFKWEKAPRPSRIDPIYPLPLDGNQDTQQAALKSLAKAVNIKSNEVFELEAYTTAPPETTEITQMPIPLDSYIDIQFQKGLNPSENVNKLIGGYTTPALASDYTETLPPTPIHYKQAHAYGLENITIEMSENGAAWESYNPYTAMLTPEEFTLFDAEKSKYKIGYWQKKGTAYDHLRILSQSPFSYTDKDVAGKYVPEKFGLTAGMLFCERRKVEKRCQSWENVATNKVFTSNAKNTGNTINYTFSQPAKVMEFPNVFNIQKSVGFEEGELRVDFPKPVRSISLKAFTYATAIEVFCYTGKERTSANLVNYQLIARDELLSEITLSLSTTASVDFIVLRKKASDKVKLTQLQEQLVALKKLRLTALGSLAVSTLNTQIQALELAIANEFHIGCVTPADDPYSGNTIDPIIYQQIADTEGEIVVITTEITTLTTQYTTAKEELSGLEQKYKTCFKNLCEYQLPPNALSCLKEMSLLPPADGATDAEYATFMADVSKFIDDIHLASIQYYIDLKKVCRDMKLYIEKKKNYIQTLFKQIETKTSQKQKLQKTLEDLNAYITAHTGIGYVRPEGYGRCGTFIHQLCWLTVEDEVYNQAIVAQAAIQEEYEAMVKGMEHTYSPIWRPNTKYRIGLTVSDRVDGSAPQVKTIYYLFHTKGPVGHWHLEDKVKTTYLSLASNVTEQQIKEAAKQKMLTSLKAYVDYTKSYPNADGNVINAKPLFYKEGKLNLFYSERYVYHFFNNWPAYNNQPVKTGELEVIIKDPSEDITYTNPPTPTFLTTTEPSKILAYAGSLKWEKDITPYLNRSASLLSNLAVPTLANPGSNIEVCIQTGGLPIQPARVKTTIIPTYLKPLKLYTALFNNKFDGANKEVHQYVFQTSRYGDFSEQVMSYQLEDKDKNQKEAIFQIKLTSKSDTAMARKIVMRTLPSATEAEYQRVVSTYADPFDQLIYGAYRLSPMEIPISTEFNVVKDEKSNIVGIWIRNPEPFNDPKLPRGKNEGDALDITDVVTQTLEIIGTKKNEYKFLWNKDLTQVFIMKSTGNILDGLSFARTSAQDFTLRFRFKFMLWDGAKYNADPAVGHVVETPGIILEKSIRKTLEDNGYSVDTVTNQVVINFNQSFNNSNFI